MKRANFESRKEMRRKSAQERQAEHDLLTIPQKLAKLKKRMPNWKTSREYKRLTEQQ